MGCIDMPASQDLYSFIRTSPWGRTLAAGDLDLVLSAAMARTYLPGESVVSTGGEANYWVGIMDGLVVQKVVSEKGEETSLTAACSGTWFGEGTLMKQGRWRYDAVVQREARVALIPLHIFQWLLDSSLAFNQFVARLLNARLGHFMELLAIGRLPGIDARVAHTLASLFDPYLYPNRSNLLPFSQSEIGLLAGVSRQRANAALKQLEADGLIEARRQGVRVIDVEGLRRR
ncbi:CRP-like cAMP-binding protein [Pelomonas saccharophila]|uniref:CRP-like cAMP-binding protein n=1 Tax=Roseateles saccharophilus TaxID=304 RepID=A0ABU1YUX6_ROSSA|nr:Crp/Fnr family transcriptional regulator [Roseateles saccharophilus]MDR7272655.1 CRP-like cAMP-binding protein [Roseateles saccharophilus]